MKRIKYLIIAAMFTASFGYVNAQTIDEGRRLTRNEQYEDAEKVFNDMIAKAPKKGDPYYWAGINLLEKGDSNAAAEMFDKGLLNSPKFLLTYVGKGHIQLRKGNNAEAESLFAMALKSKKKLRPVVNREIGRAYLMVADRPKATMVSNAVKALEYLDRASIEDFEVLMLQGDALFTKNPGNGSEPINKFILAGYSNENSPMPLLKEGMIYQRVENYEVSMIRVDEALSKDLNFAPAYRQKAELYTLMKKRDSAVLYYREYLKRNNNLSAKRKFVSALYLNGEMDEAIKEAKDLLKQKEFTNLYGVIAYAIVEKKDTNLAVNQEGLEYFELYEQKHVNPANRVLSTSEMYYKGTLLNRVGQKEAGWAMHKKALMDTARAPIRYYDQARETYYLAKDYSKAIDVLNLKMAKTKDRSDLDLYYLAMSKRYIGSYTESNSLFEEIIKHDSTYVKGYYYIAQNEYMMDPDDSTGNPTAAYTRWMSKLNKENQEKYRSDIVQAYRNMAEFSDKKAGKTYASAEDKASGFSKTIEHYKKSIELYQTILNYEPGDEGVKSWIETLKKFVASLEKRKATRK